MKLYQLYARQAFPISMKEAWDFLSSPGNLAVITPDHMGFEILSGADKDMFPGQIIQYRVSPFKGVNTHWVTEITHVKDGEYFVDEQRFGPYALWHHKHFIAACEEGVIMEDIIDYKLPFGFLGRMVHPFLVKRQLEKIFEYRETKLTDLFGQIPNMPNTLEFRAVSV